ncbi:unnamed protein product, partial [Amoebophrya sp. A25]|eukprot:GSA25T00000990001.1
MQPRSRPSWGHEKALMPMGLIMWQIFVSPDGMLLKMSFSAPHDLVQEQVQQWHPDYRTTALPYEKYNTSEEMQFQHVNERAGQVAGTPRDILNESLSAASSKVKGGVQLPPAYRGHYFSPEKLLEAKTPEPFLSKKGLPAVSNLMSQ